ncbi:hypothetical protein FP435_07180 [Lactobacillus sp. PV037]|uniref:hypothetical protein n=1 Tax=unclassified Lactobacillus TaxID=2620435 RepID=UPI002240BC66|nr:MULTISPECIES: hypothetical protein [unclassified Lactobacillus]QNQ81741.1 hypothetical protein FP433_01065 [Lactobacillus sp. PV012]QNQ84214.1 hypothetical protein FP435_07180 [Lactobacillus sp. PV037]
MKKAKLLAATVALGAMLTTTACSNQAAPNTNSSSYTALMAAGKKAAKAQNYDEAKEKFDQASKIKNTTEAQAYAEQAAQLDQAKTSINNYNYESSLSSLNSAIGQKGGYSVMTDQAKKLYGIAEEVQNNLDNELTPLYKKAQTALDSQNYDQAQEYATEILSQPYLDGQYKEYYTDIRAKAQNILDKAKKESNNNETSSSSAKDKSSSKSSSEESTSSSSSSSEDSSSSSSSATNSSDDTIDGQAVTSRTINQVRAKLDDIGADTSSWSDQDVINFMKSAANSGHTTIDSYTQSDVDNYNK